MNNPTEEQIQTINIAKGFVKELMINNRFDQNNFNKIYEDAVSDNGKLLGMSFALNCVSQLSKHKPIEMEFRVPKVLKVLNTLKNDEIKYALECFQVMLEDKYPYYTQKMFNDLIEKSMKNIDGFKSEKPDSILYMEDSELVKSQMKIFISSEKLDENHIKIVNSARDFATELLENNTFDKNSFNNQYQNGQTNEGKHFGMCFALSCLNRLARKHQLEIIQSGPTVLKLLNNTLNENEFNYGIETFKVIMKEQDENFNEVVLNKFIKDSVGKSDVENNQFTDKVSGESKSDITKNISQLRESNSTKNENKLKNN